MSVDLQLDQFCGAAEPIAADDVLYHIFNAIGIAPNTFMSVVLKQAESRTRQRNSCRGLAQRYLSCIMC